MQFIASKVVFPICIHMIVASINTPSTDNQKELSTVLNEQRAYKTTDHRNIYLFSLRMHEEQFEDNTT